MYAITPPEHGLERLSQETAKRGCARPIFRLKRFFKND